MQTMPMAADPTAVVGKRVGAALIDVLLMLLLSIGLTFALLDVQSLDLSGIPERARPTCTGFDDGYGQTQVEGTCFTINDTLWYVSGGPTGAVQLIQLVVGGAIFWWWQGKSGKTPGKVVLGIRTVNAQGQPPGILAAFLRSILWIVDAAPWIIPGLLGLVTASSSKGHRRVGDMVASTYVVNASALGFPVPVAGAAAAVPAGGWATPAPGAPAPGAPMPGAPAPGAPMPGAPAPGAPTPAQVPPADLPTTPAAPAADPTQPKWDPERNAYIAWDAAAQRWQQHDEATGQWRPI